MITTTIAVDASPDTITICRIEAAAKQLRDSAELLAYYAIIASAGDESPETISRRVETAIATGCMIAVEKLGGTVTNTTIDQKPWPATK